MSETQLTYWKQQLAERPTALELPADYPRPISQTLRGAHCSLVLSKALTEKLKMLAQEEEGTLFMALLGAFSILLARYSGQDDLLIGTPIPGDAYSRGERVRGLFSPALILRVRLTGDPTFRELFRRVRELTAEAYAHQDFSFAQLVEALRAEQDQDHSSLFNVMITFATTSQATLEAPEVAPDSLDTGEREALFPLTLHAEEREGELLLRLVYQRDLFSEERIRLFLSQFEYLLEQAVEWPERPVGSYSLVSPESRLLLPDPTEVLPEPHYELVTDMITSWATRAPAQPAIRQAGQQWSYRELVERAQAIARILVGRGVRRGDVVAVRGARSFGLIASLTGVFMSGAVLLTIDRALPVRRQQVMLQEAGAKVLVSIDDRQTVIPEEPYLPELGSVAVEPLSGQIVDGAFSVDQQAIQLPKLLPGDAAYLFFTSGTTGVPKGVLGLHKGLSHFLNWQRATFAVAPGDRSAQLTGISFDVVLRDIFLPLVSGATLSLPEKDEGLAPDLIIPWLAREAITTIHMVPTLAKALLSEAPAGARLPALRRVFFAGEPLTGVLVRRWRETFGTEGEIINLYGPTETTLAKCYYRVPLDARPGVQPVGRPLPETQALVLGKDGRLCGIGEPGEIAIRTPFRTLGYINVPQENRRFVKNPFRADEQDMLYYTGDQGRYALDGQLEILGRIDEQVKIRGIRIELREIELTLMQHPAVREAVVTVHEERLWDERTGEDAGEKRLIAYVVLKSAQESLPAEAELRSFLQGGLPTSMVPSAFIVLSALPLTTNGKLDRRALPVPESVSQKRQHSPVPRTPTEALVAGIWEQVLKQEAIGLQDDFFALGGHSLLAFQIISRLRDTFQVDVPLQDFFEAPTVAELAELIARLQAMSSTPRGPVLRAVSREPYRIPTSSQEARKSFASQD